MHDVLEAGSTPAFGRLVIIIPTDFYFKNSGNNWD